MTAAMFLLCWPGYESISTSLQTSSLIIVQTGHLVLTGACYDVT